MKIASLIYTLTLLSFDAEANLLVNGNFEDGAAGPYGSITIPGWTAYFTCAEGPRHDSGWQNSTLYRDTNLTPGTEYTYTVKTRDLSFEQNETAPSLPASTVTNAGTEISFVNGNFEQGNGTDIGSNTIGYFIPTVDDNDSWKSISAVIASPANASAVKIIAQLCNADEVLSAGSVNFDNISISATGPQECVKSDFNCDCRVNIDDVGVLAENWQEIYTLADLAEMADIWLGCIMHEQLDCY